MQPDTRRGHRGAFVTDGDTWQEHAGDIPAMEFYEGYELANQFDNWVGPSVACLQALCRAAGFARVELLRVEPFNAQLACYRKWEAPPAVPPVKPPELVSVAHNSNLGINFSSRKEEYLSCWFRTSRTSLSKEDLRLETGGFGVAACFAGREPDGSWVANFPLARGLAPGWHSVRLRLADSDFGNPLRIAVDLPLQTGGIVCVAVQDALSWRHDEVTVADGGYLVCWMGGLPENCDRNNVRVWLGDTRLPVRWIGMADSAGSRQVNAVIPAGFAKKEWQLTIECGGVRSAPRTVTVL